MWPPGWHKKKGILRYLELGSFEYLKCPSKRDKKGYQKRTVVLIFFFSNFKTWAYVSSVTSYKLLKEIQISTNILTEKIYRSFSVPDSFVNYLSLFFVSRFWSMPSIRFLNHVAMLVCFAAGCDWMICAKEKQDWRFVEIGTNFQSRCLIILS